MELKNYIEDTSKFIIPTIDHLQLVDYKDKELDFAYGLQEYPKTFTQVFKQIKRKLWR